MSDALDYLVKVRPQAMGHYFAFLKDAGQHLDPKTRSLISVITKVHSQTERGLRQYLKRALRDGCTAAEVLDALLMAFPTLGLARIVWATDVILAMSLPEFQALAAGTPTAPAAAAPAPAQWRDVMASADAPQGQVLRVDCQGRGLFVYRDKRKFQVYDSRCPHQGADMPATAAQGSLVTCAKHQWQFDAKSGDCIKTGNSPLQRIESKLVKGRLLAFC